jgi:hypothetical protein
MNSRSRIPSTWPRTTRAIGHHENRMMTTTVIISPGPARATSEIAKSRNGRLNVVSISHESTRSTQPPRKPAARPIAVPRPTAASVEIAPTMIDTRAP